MYGLLAGIETDFAEFTDLEANLRMIVRMLFAAGLGGVLGWQREAAGKEAGMRTYMMVSLATAFVMNACLAEGFTNGDLSRVVQGLLTGVGFLGAGAILKLEQDRDIQGLTTAAGIWLTSIIGIAVGMGHLGLATAVTVFAFIILQVLVRFGHGSK